MRSLHNSTVLALLILSLSVTQVAPVAHAGLVGTQTLLTENTAQQQRQQILTALSRDEVKQALTDHGVTLDQAQLRIEQLTDVEIRNLAERLDVLPAGAGDAAAGIAIAALILIILELLGVIDIFTQF